MESQKGITLTSLVIYVIVLTIVISIIAVVSSLFYNNINKIKAQENYPSEFNKFNMFFINDIKQNKEANVENGKITFMDGTNYEYNAEEKAIYRNGNVITSDVTSLEFSLSKYEATEKTTKNIVTVKISIGNNFEESIEYTLKYW